MRPDCLSGKEQLSSRKNAVCLLLTLLLIGGVMLLLNHHTPLMMDDYDYSFSWKTGERIAGIGEIAASQAEHYRLWGGRSVVHFLVQLFLYIGKPAFNLANALMYLLLILEIDTLARPKGMPVRWTMLLCIHVCLFCCVSFFGTVFLWLDGACNYLWGTTLALIPLVLTKCEREGADVTGRTGLLAVPVCFVAGWTNENTACGVAGALFLLIVWDRIKGRRVARRRYVWLAAQLFGAAVMLLAPGNFARAGQEAARAPVMELIYRFAVVSYCLIREAGVPIVFAALLYAAARKHKGAVCHEWLCVLCVCAFLCAYALVGSPQISDRSFTSVIALTAAALAAVLYGWLPAAKGNILGAALAVLALVGGGFADCDAAAHSAAWQVQLQEIETAKAAGEQSVVIEGVPSVSRYTMDIVIEKDASVWPNSTLSKYFGIDILGI